MVKSTSLPNLQDASEAPLRSAHTTSLSPHQSPVLHRVHTSHAHHSRHSFKYARKPGQFKSVHRRFEIDRKQLARGVDDSVIHIGHGSLDSRSHPRDPQPQRPQCVN